jgi:hypothetical protein
VELLVRRRTEAEKEQEKVRLKKVKEKEERDRWEDRAATVICSKESHIL